ncbi:unnamed protein product [Ostreobium quekettii]|uniref:Uncharacterized protein n=1 Tax=Ostreobium quekettii TaxID=121088 RepID=A0A8S1JG68_9CHLO|nr:unnamed protein product [Ostreobium quekettii]
MRQRRPLQPPHPPFWLPGRPALPPCWPGSRAAAPQMRPPPPRAALVPAAPGHPPPSWPPTQALPQMAAYSAMAFFRPTAASSSSSWRPPERRGAAAGRLGVWPPKKPPAPWWAAPGRPLTTRARKSKSVLAWVLAWGAPARGPRAGWAGGEDDGAELPVTLKLVKAASDSSVMALALPLGDPSLTALPTWLAKGERPGSEMAVRFVSGPASWCVS